MRQRTKLAFAMLLSSCLFSGNYSRLNAQVNSFQVSSEDTKAIEAILHSNPTDHVTEEPLVAVGMFLAGLLLLGLSLYGCLAIMGLTVPPGTWKDGLLEFALVSGFPLFMLSFRSVRLCIFALWLYFIANWLAWCLCTVPVRFFWPVDIYLALVLAPVVTVQLCYLVWPNRGERSPRAQDVLA